MKNIEIQTVAVLNLLLRVQATRTKCVTVAQIEKALILNKEETTELMQALQANFLFSVVFTVSKGWLVSIAK